jgi:2-hydroxychromene-2-carboxylate isomerase
MRGVIVADKYNKLVSFSYSCFEMYWSKGLDISDLDILSEIAVTNGIDKDIFINEIQTKLIKDQLRENTDNLIERGGFGSPTIFINEDDMYFGNDRLQLVKEKILGNF